MIFFLQPNIRDKLTALESRLTMKLPATSGDLSPVLGLATSSVEFQSLTGRDIGTVNDSRDIFRAIDIHRRGDVWFLERSQDIESVARDCFKIPFDI